jgi:hypothetical protein
LEAVQVYFGTCFGQCLDLIIYIYSSSVIGGVGHIK